MIDDEIKTQLFVLVSEMMIQRARIIAEQRKDVAENTSGVDSEKYLQEHIMFSKIADVLEELLNVE